MSKTGGSWSAPHDDAEQRVVVGGEPTTDDGKVVMVALSLLSFGSSVFDSVPPLTRLLLCCPVKLRLELS